MSLPKISNNNVRAFLDTTELVSETAKQIIKDFGLFGIEITFSGDTLNAYQELHEQLVEQIGVLIQSNYQLLLSVLYQVDIRDKDLHDAARELPHYTEMEIIAHQVIVRDLQKVLLRRHFKNSDQNSSMEELDV